MTAVFDGLGIRREMLYDNEISPGFWQGFMLRIKPCLAMI